MKEFKIKYGNNNEEIRIIGLEMFQLNQAFDNEAFLIPDCHLQIQLSHYFINTIPNSPH
jgi:hypothetical protein